MTKTHRSLKDALAATDTVTHLRIDLDDDDALTADIGKLTSLEDLNIDECAPETVWPSELGQLSALKELTLDAAYGKRCKLDAVFGRLDNLETLSLTRVDLDGAPEMRSVTDLKLYDVEDVQGTIEAVARCMPRLKHLSVNGDDAKAGPLPDAVGDLSELESLDLSSCNLTSWGNGLSRLSRLRVFSCDSQDNEHGAMPDAVAELTSLEDLTWNNEIDTLPSSLSRLSSLKTLRLRGALGHGKAGRVALPEVIGELRALEDLTLDRCQLLDVASLSRLSNLKKLSMSSAEITDLSGLAALTSVEELDIAYVDSVKDLTPIASMTSLKSLNMSDTQPKSIDFLKPLTNLKTLDVDSVKMNVLKPLFEEPLLSRIEMERDPDEDEEYIEEWRLRFFSARTLNTLPDLETIKRNLESAVGQSASTAEEALEQALLYAEATSTSKRRALGIVFGDEPEPVPAEKKKKGKKRRDDDDDDEERDEDDEDEDEDDEDEDDEDEDEDDEDEDDDDDDDDDDRPRKKKAKEPLPQPVSLPLIEKLVDDAGVDLSDKVLLHLLRVTFKNSGDKYPVAVAAAKLLAPRESAQEALGAAILAAYDRSWVRRPRKETVHDRLVDEVYPLMLGKSLAQIVQGSPSKMLPEKGDGVLTHYPHALATASREDAETLINELESLLRYERKSVGETALKALFDAALEQATEHEEILKPLANKHLGWFAVDRDLKSAIPNKAGKLKKGASADAANARLLSLGEEGGLDKDALSDHRSELSTLISGSHVSLEAQRHFVRFVYRVSGDETDGTAQRAMRNIAKDGLDGLAEALEPLIELERAKKKGLITDLEEMPSLDEELDKDAVFALADRVAGRTAEEGNVDRAKKTIADKINNFGSDDDDYKAFYAALDLVSGDLDLEDDPSWELKNETDTLVGNEKYEEAFRILDHLDRFKLDDEERQNVYAELVEALEKCTDEALREKIMSRVGDVADLKSEELAFELCKDAARRKDHSAVLALAKKAHELGKSDYEFDDDVFEAFAKDADFKAAIGKEDDDEEESSSSSDDSSDDDDDDGDDDEEEDGDDD